MTLDDLFDRCTPEPNSGCWLWMGSTAQGYGQVWLSEHKKIFLAHRVSYERKNGPIKEGMVIDHLCRTRCCINPDHLEVVSQRENILRGVGATAKNITKTHCSKCGRKLEMATISRRKTKNWQVQLRRCQACRTAYMRKYLRDYYQRSKSA